jgi:predicted dehydrogenase
MVMERVRVAVIGAGFIADYHLAALATVPQASVCAIASRSAVKAEALARRWGVALATTDVDRVLEGSAVDAVIITTPDDTHEDLAIRAAKARKAVLLQKPMATDSAACRRIIAAAREAGVDLQVSFMHRYFEEVVRAGALIREGAIGRVESLRIRNATPGPDWSDWFFKRDRIGAGAVLQLGTHGIDLVEYLFGAIDAVSARTATLRATRRLADGREVPVENSDSAWATYTLASGAVASHEISMIEQRGTDRFRMEIYGSLGAIWLRSELGALSVASARSGSCGWIKPPLPQPPFGQRQHRRWLAGLLGIEPPEQTARAGLRTLLVAEAIERSSATGGGDVPIAAEDA